MSLQKSFADLIAKAVADGVAPGIVAVAFNRTGTVVETAAGVKSLETKEPIKVDSVVWMASMSKAITATVALKIADELGVDIDSHEDLVKYVPEVKKRPGNPFWQIFDGKDEKGNWKFKEAKVPVTLRHFFTHTSGVPYWFDSEPRAWLASLEPNKDLEPGRHGIPSLFAQRDFDAGEKFLYGENCEVYGLFATRATGKTWRQLLKEHIYEPLGIPKDTLDNFRTEDMNKRLVDVKYRNPDGSFKTIPFDYGGYEGAVPENEYESAGGFLYGTIPSYAIFARSLLNKTAPAPGGKPILHEKLFERATVDDLALSGLDIRQDTDEPFMPAVDPSFTAPLKRFNSPQPTLGWTLLNTLYNRGDTDRGIHKGSLQWSGAANSFYFVDPISGVGGVFATMTFPFGFEEVIEFRQVFEEWVEKNIKN